MIFVIVLKLFRIPGGGGYSTNVFTGRLCPEVQPLTLLYTIFHEKVFYLFIWFYYLILLFDFIILPNTMNYRQNKNDNK